MGEGSKRPVMMVEMERWDRCVMYGVKSYSVVPVAATWCVADAELCCDSPVEVKHRKLSRSLHRALVDRNLQPDSQERRQIQVGGIPPTDFPVPCARGRFTLCCLLRASGSFLLTRWPRAVCRCY